MTKLFSYDGPLHKFVDKMANLMILNFLCFLCCIPIVTIGPAITALYYVTMKMARNEEGGIVRDFFHSFRMNFKQGMVVGLIVVGLGVFLAFDMYYIYQMAASGGVFDSIVFGVIAIAIIIYLMASTYIFPLLARFENTTKQTIRTAAFLAIRHLPATLAMIVLAAAPVLMLLGPPGASTLAMLFYFILGVPTVAYFQSSFLNRIFIQYIPSEPVETEEETEGEEE